MKKKRKVKYKRKEVYRKREIFFQILREMKREIHGEKCSEKNLMNKALILYYSGNCLVFTQISHCGLLQTRNIN